MKRLLSICLGLVVCAACMAYAEGQPDSAIVSFATVTTNEATGTGTKTYHDGQGFLNGWVHSIILDLGGYASPTVDVDIVTVGSTGNGPSRTILSIDDVVADAVYVPRLLSQSTAGVDLTEDQAALIPLLQDQVKVDIYAANVTNVITASVILIMK